MQSELWKSTANWFAEWFNCPAYHLLYGNRNEEEALDFVERLCDAECPPAPAMLLDLGCGAGRHVRSFEALGYLAHGVDLSKESITRARSLASFPNRFEVADMRSFADELNWKARFDVVTSLFTSFGYFEQDKDLKATLDQIRSSLRPSGTFILDFLNLPQVAATLVPAETALRITPEGSTMQFHIHRRIHAGWIEKDIAYNSPAGEFHHFVERVRAFSPQDLVSLLDSSGFTVRAIYGDYQLHAHSEASNRCILVAS